MRAWLAIVILCGVAGPGLSFAAGVQILRLSRAGESIAIPFTIEHGLLMNDVCSRNLERCQAYQADKKIASGALRAKTPFSPKGNPAAMFCKDIGGISLILTDVHSNQVAICGFEDRSLASAWDLFRARRSGK